MSKHEIVVVAVPVSAHDKIRNKLVEVRDAWLNDTLDAYTLKQISLMSILGGADRAIKNGRLEVDISDLRQSMVENLRDEIGEEVINKVLDEVLSLEVSIGELRRPITEGLRSELGEDVLGTLMDGSFKLEVDILDIRHSMVEALRSEVGTVVINRAFDEAVDEAMSTYLTPHPDSLK